MKSDVWMYPTFVLQMLKLQAKYFKPFLRILSLIYMCKICRQNGNKTVHVNDSYLYSLPTTIIITVPIYCWWSKKAKSSRSIPIKVGNGTPPGLDLLDVTPTKVFANDTANVNLALGSIYISKTLSWNRLPQHQLHIQQVHLPPLW